MGPDKNARLLQGTTEFGKFLKPKSPLNDEIKSIKIDGAPCLHVSTYRALIRVAGYFKYQSKSNVLFRGQASCCGSMKASLHRSDPPSDRVVDAFLNRFRKEFDVDPEPVHRLATEPLLQHYGINTRWLDVVDSLPHALFFATHKLRIGGCPLEMDTYVPSGDEYGFLYVIDIGFLRRRKIAGEEIVGCFRTSNGLAVVDLRVLKPSNALRPHAQHGLLIRAESSDKELWPQLVARIAVPSQEARQWIAAAALERETLFPSPVWDRHYGMLLSGKMGDFLMRERRPWGRILRFDFATDQLSQGI